jgi:hypothetical protein
MIEISDWSYHQNNKNSFIGISKLNVNDITNDMPNCAKADVNFNAGNSIFIYTDLNQQLKIMLSDIIDCHETVSDQCGYSEKAGRSRSSMAAYNPALTLLPFKLVCDKSEKPTLSFLTGINTWHTVLAEMVNCGIKWNSIMSSVPNNTAAALKNPLNFSKNKLSMKMIQTKPVTYGIVQVDRESLFSPQLCESNTYGNASHQNIMDIGQSSSDICADYLKHIFIKANADISLYKLFEIFNSAANSQHVLDSGSCKAHKILCVSNIHDVSVSEDNDAQSETLGKLADKISVISSYCNHSVENRLSKMKGKTNMPTTWQRKSLQTVNNILCPALPTSIHNNVSWYNSHRSCCNASYCWQEGNRCQILETYNAINKNSQIRADCLQKHSCPEGDGTSSSECKRVGNFTKGCEFCGRKVIHVNSAPFKPDFLLLKSAVTTESKVSASLEQHNSENDRREPSNITRQNKLMGIDSVYGTEGTDKTGTSAMGHPIIMSQKIRSLSQPSLPTYLLHNDTDDEQLSEDTEDESDSLSDAFTACGHIHHGNVLKLMGHLTEDTEENRPLEMPYSAINVVSYKTNEETEIADSNQDVYMVESHHLDTNVTTEVKKNICFTELCDKSQELHMKNDEFCKGEKLSYSSSFEMNTSNNDQEVPSVITQDMNTWYREDGYSLEMESDVSQSITGIEEHVNKIEYPRKIKQHLLFPQSQNYIFGGSKVIQTGNIQCEACILPNIGSWNRSEIETYTEEAKSSNCHATVSSYTSCTEDENIQFQVHAHTLPSDSDTNKRQMYNTISQKHGSQADILHCTETTSRRETCMIISNMSTPEYINTQRAQMSPRPYSPDIVCSNNCSQHLPGQDHTVSPKSDPESVSYSWEDNYHQHQPMACPCTQNRHSQNQMSQVHNNNSEDTLHSSIDLVLKKYDSDIHKQQCYTKVQPTQDVTVQTNIRSLITAENQNYCFVCFSNNSNLFNNKNLKDESHQNLALKRHIEALYLESVSLNKKRRYDNLKLIESHISELPTNHTSSSGNSDVNEGSSCDDNKDINFKYHEYLPKVQDTSIINLENFVDSDHKVPDVGKDISWMDDTNQRELYMTGQIMKGKLIRLIITVLSNLCFSLPS